MHLVETPEDVAKLDIQNPQHMAYVTQTTLSVDDTTAIISALKQHYPAIEGPKKDDICYATQNRQDAVKSLSDKADVVLVIGSRNSSNSNRLREIAENRGVPAYLIDGAEDLQEDWLKDKQIIGVTAGASAPEILVRQVISQLEAWGGESATELNGTPENVVFSLPKGLLRLEAQRKI
jgi:4-hydroxy-3-methylbut-2-enyl diphosphate reductase